VEEGITTTAVEVFFSSLMVAATTNVEALVATGAVSCAASERIVGWATIDESMTGRGDGDLSLKYHKTKAWSIKKKAAIIKGNQIKEQIIKQT
jgi:hypothetical protein